MKVSLLLLFLTSITVNNFSWCGVKISLLIADWIVIITSWRVKNTPRLRDWYHTSASQGSSCIINIPKLTGRFNLHLVSAVSCTRRWPGWVLINYKPPRAVASLWGSLRLLNLKQQSEFPSWDSQVIKQPSCALVKTLRFSSCDWWKSLRNIFCVKATLIRSFAARAGGVCGAEALHHTRRPRRDSNVAWSLDSHLQTPESQCGGPDC